MTSLSEAESNLVERPKSSSVQELINRIQGMGSILRGNLEPGIYHFYIKIRAAWLSEFLELVRSFEDAGINNLLAEYSTLEAQQESYFNLGKASIDALNTISPLLAVPEKRKHEILTEIFGIVEAKITQEAG